MRDSGALVSAREPSSFPVAFTCSTLTDVAILPSVSFESESKISVAQDVKLNKIVNRNNFTNMGG
jgi:hypothetical protein